jgi:hypothetical protein
VCLRTAGFQALCGDDGKTTLSESKKVITLCCINTFREIATNEWGSASAIAAMAVVKLNTGNNASWRRWNSHSLAYARHEKPTTFPTLKNPFRLTRTSSYPVSSRSTTELVLGHQDQLAAGDKRDGKKLKTKQESGSISYLTGDW